VDQRKTPQLYAFEIQAKILTRKMKVFWATMASVRVFWATGMKRITYSYLQVTVTAKTAFFS
jgi:hypothetical protein